MSKQHLGWNTAAVSRLAWALLAAAAWCAQGTAATDSAAPTAQALDRTAYDDPNGDTHVVCLADASQSYELYIPASVPATGPAPICYGFDPSANGKGTLLSLAAAASANGWILAVSNNASNTLWTTIFTAQDALLTDTEARLNLSPTRRFAAGMSGGARMSLALAFRYPAKICGTLLLGAGWPLNTTLSPSTDRLVVYMIMGTQDSNYAEDIPETQGALAAWGIRCAVQTFDGGHVWPPASLVLAGSQWLNKYAEVDPNSGLKPAVCPEHSLFCQPPSTVDSAWGSLISDTETAQSVFEHVQGVALPIAAVDWWGVTATYNSAYAHWLPCDPPPDRFTISLHPDNGGAPGTAVHEETVTALREDLPNLYNRNYPLRHYHATLSAPVTLASGWVRIQQVREAEQCVLLLDSPTGDGQCLLRSETDGDVPCNDDLAISLGTEEMVLDVAASRRLGAPPLTVQFSGKATENVVGVINWRWDFGDGDIVEGKDESSPIHTYDGEGAYTVTLTVSTDLSTATVTKRGFIVVTQTLSLATPGLLGATIAAFLLVGASAVRAKRRPCDL